MSTSSPEKNEFLERFERIKAVAIIGAIGWSAMYLLCSMSAKILVEPVSVPKTMAETGLSDTAAQRALVTALQKVISDARETMPGEITDEIQADEPEVSINIPETGLSLQAVIQGSKRMFGIKDVTIRSAIFEKNDAADPTKPIAQTANANKKFIARVYVTEPSADVEAETTPPSSSLDTLSEAALKIMKLHNPFIFASALATRERADCYDKGKCDFEKSTAAFADVLKDEKYRRYHRWSWLALSKIDEDQGKYAAETTKAMLAAQIDKRFYWAYYNWGVGLSEQGCDEEALDAFDRARKYRPLKDFLNNAEGRQALLLAEKYQDVAREKHESDLKLALKFLWFANQLNRNYPEAKVNLARALKDAASETAVSQAAVRASAIPYLANYEDTLDSVLYADSVHVKRARSYAISWGLIKGGDEEQSVNPKNTAKSKQFADLDQSADMKQSAVNTLLTVHDDDPKCTRLQLADSILETKGCKSNDDVEAQSREDRTAITNAQQVRKLPLKARSCTQQSIRTNLKDDEYVTPPNY